MKPKIFLILVLMLLCKYLAAQHWQSVGGRVNDAILYMYPDSVTNLLYVGGSFKWFDTLYAPSLASWNGMNWAKLDGSVDDVADAFCNFHDTLFVGGSFFFAGGMYSPYLAKWKNEHWFPYGIANGPVTCFAIWNDELYAVGDFDSIGGIRANGIAKYNGSSWSSVGNLFGFSSPNNNLLGKVVVLNNILYIGGFIYDSIGGYPDFASWDGMNWKYYYNMFQGPYAGGYPWVRYKGQDYVIGLFYKGDGNAANNVATLDGISLHDVGGGITSQYCCAHVTDAYVFHDKLYVVGIFDSAGGVPAHNIASWDGEKWCGFGDTFDNRILTINSYHDTLYIGGGFWTINGDSINYIAKWLGGDYVDTCSVSTGISEVTQSNYSLSVYPNPVNTDFHIVLRGMNHTNRFEITNTLGQLLKKGRMLNGSVSIDVNELPKGVYLLQIEDEKGRLATKFIKE